jgi:hypothetical protein
VHRCPSTCQYARSSTISTAEVRPAPLKPDKWCWRLEPNGPDR